MNFSETLVTIVLAAFMFTFVYIVNGQSCESRTRGFQDSEYTFLAGCMVRYDGTWVPLENWRYGAP